jgi:hypothetical protein
MGSEHLVMSDQEQIRVICFRQETIDVENQTPKTRRKPGPKTTAKNQDTHENQRKTSKTRDVENQSSKTRTPIIKPESKSSKQKQNWIQITRELKIPSPKEGTDMTIARQQQISLDHTPYYHCTTRCVRRAFLCGIDRYSGKNFDHRKDWLEKRLVLLSQVFAIDLLAYAVMSNHYHVVVRINIDAAHGWSQEEVVDHWGQVYSTPDVIDSDVIETWRDRLTSLSWFMRCLNEPMARSANKEDHCKGRFWEGRFRCQALLDESALLRCMAYVDLNPIRAAVAKTPETSSHTSIKARIDGNDDHLMPFDDANERKTSALPVRRDDYLQLVDWTGRQISRSKRGYIPERLPPILDRLHLDGGAWLKEMKYYGRWYYRAVGSLDSLQRYCEYLGQRWLKGSPNVVVKVA